MFNALTTYASFMREQLVPAASKSLMASYNAYCGGDDLGAALKEDGTPASRADRDTEKLLRELIAATFPDHGIAGEEYGVERENADYVWVLDPLDGTKEFLAKNAGWGILIGLLCKGKPVIGAIVDPQMNKVWDQDFKPATSVRIGLVEKAVVSTTAPKIMFDGTRYEQGAQALYRRCAVLKERLNCLGFACIAEGGIDVVAENDLKLHDIAALLPVLWSSDAVCYNLEGEDYKNLSFDVSEAETARYSLISSRDHSLASAVLNILRGE